MTNVLYCQIPDDQMPQPGTAVHVQMSNGMVAQVWNLRDGRQLDEMTSHSLHYVPVRTASVRQHVIHAAINRRLHGRNRHTDTTLCSRDGDDRRIVASIISGSLDDTVTCHQCRKQLAADGALTTA